jgi:hypothetical protein
MSAKVVRATRPVSILVLVRARLPHMGRRLGTLRFSSSYAALGLAHVLVGVLRGSRNVRAQHVRLSWWLLHCHSNLCAHFRDSGDKGKEEDSAKRLFEQVHSINM